MGPRSDLRTFTLTLPLPPNLANQRVHWRRRISQKDAYRQKVRNTVLMIPWQVRRPKGAPWRRVHIEAKVYVWNLMDMDNLWARLKWPVDALVQEGYIVDDSPKFVRWGPVEQEVDRGYQRVQFTLTLLEEEDAEVQEDGGAGLGGGGPEGEGAGAGEAGEGDGEGGSEEG